MNAGALGVKARTHRCPWSGPSGLLRFPSPRRPASENPTGDQHGKMLLFGAPRVPGVLHLLAEGGSSSRLRAGRRPWQGPHGYRTALPRLGEGTQLLPSQGAGPRRAAGSDRAQFIWGEASPPEAH